jgi:hypothetical protein
MPANEPLPFACFVSPPHAARIEAGLGKPLAGCPFLLADSVKLVQNYSAGFGDLQTSNLLSENMEAQNGNTKNPGSG